MTSVTRRFGFGFLLLLLAGGIWLGVHRVSRPLKNSPRLYEGPIAIGEITWPGYLGLYVARDQGFFKEAGLNVEIKRYDAMADLSRDYIAGKIQGRANLTLEMVNESLQGLDQRVILVIDYSNGSDAIVASSAVADLKEIRGKRVAYEPNTLEEFFLTWALRETGLALADVQMIPAAPEEAARQLLAGNADVAVSYEPFISEVLGKGGFHKIYSSADAPGLITDILTFRQDFIETYPDTVRAIMKAYFKALHFYQENPGRVREILSKEFGNPPEVVAKQLEGVKILDETENRIAFTFAGGLQSLYGNLRQIGEFVLSRHSGAALNTDNLIEPRFIREVAEQED